jgi:hypothetical protein
MAGRMRSVLGLLTSTADPAAAADADLWYRSDLGRVRARVNGAVKGLAHADELTLPLGSYPKPSAGQTWISVPGFGGAVTAVAPTVSRAHYIPFPLNVATRFTQIGLYVTTAVASTTVTVGYCSANADMSPGALVTTWGTIGTASSNAVNARTIDTTLSAGMYWIVLQTGATVSTFAHINCTSPYVTILGNPTVVNGWGMYVGSPGAAGALPTTPSYVSGTGNTLDVVPRIMLRPTP